MVHSDFWLFEASIWLHVLARSMIAVFVPIIMLTIGFTLFDVILYYFIYHAIDVPLNFVARKSVRLYGARKTMIVANLATITFFLLLTQLTAGAWGILIAMAFFNGVYDAFYWVAHLFLFMESNHEKKSSKKDTSILYMVKRAAGLLGPAVGAVILIFVSESALIYVTITLLFLSLIPLMKAKNLPDKPTQSQKPWRAFFKNTHEKKNYLTFTLFTLHRNSELLIWPLFVFLTVETIESVAMLPIIISIVAILFSYVAGRVQEKNQQKIMTLSGIVIILVWLARMVVAHELFLYVSVFIVGIFSIFVNLPIDSRLFERGRQVDTLSASMWRNTTSMSIRTIIFGALFLLVGIFEVSIGIAIVGIIGFVLMQHMTFSAVSKKLS